MKFWLLTHERELLRKTNTGECVLITDGIEAARVLWMRKEPNEELLSIIASQSVVVLYPSEQASNLSTQLLGTFEHVIVLDATWQEAQKMMNQSPYLKSLPKVKLNSEQPSIYKLRRNQRGNGLCTAECVSEILKLDNQTGLSTELLNELNILQQI